MIISASRVTDIPGLYSQWFMNRVRAGDCLVPNTANPRQVEYVSLAPQDVDAIVFWSKDPAPMFSDFDEFDSRGFRYYFQFTLNDYPKELEPLIPDFDTRLNTFLELSRRIGPRRVIWRYDPIIISNRTSYEFHRETFSRIAEQLHGATCRVTLSIILLYQKLDRRMAELEQQGFYFKREKASLPRMQSLLKDFSAIARKRSMEITLCSQAQDFSHLGLSECHCIDSRLINSLWGLNLPYEKDPAMRRTCQCTISKDIGIGDTCINGCPYCYSVRSNEFAQRRYKEHNPHSPALWGISS